MRDIGKNLKRYLKNSVTNFATCIKIELHEGKTIGFTEHINNITIDNIVYNASGGIFSSAIESSSDFSIDNLEVTGFLDSDKITKADIENGKYDNAYIEIFVVDYTEVNLGKIVLKSGYLGEVRHVNNQFRVEVRGISDLFTKRVTESYSSTCRATFCDNQCKMKRDKFIKHGSINNILNDFSIEFIGSKIENSKLYENIGTIKFISGPNIGLSSSIESCYNITIIFLTKFPNKMSIGDKFVLYQGCDKKFETCCNIYNNAINFRGEPHLPGIDEIMKTSGTYM